MDVAKEEMNKSYDNYFEKRFNEIHQKLQNEIVTVEAGGGFVKVTMSCVFELIRIEYDNSPIIKDDMPMFVDLIQIAIKECLRKIKLKNAQVIESIYNKYS